MPSPAPVGALKNKPAYCLRESPAKLRPYPCWQQLCVCVWGGCFGAVGPAHICLTLKTSALGSDTPVQVDDEKIQEGVCFGVHGECVPSRHGPGSRLAAHGPASTVLSALLSQQVSLNLE